MGGQVDGLVLPVSKERWWKAGEPIVVQRQGVEGVHVDQHGTAQRPEDENYWPCEKKQPNIKLL